MSSENNSPLPQTMSEGALNLMQERLAGAETETKDLADMLMDLGITPNKDLLDDQPYQLTLQSPEFPTSVSHWLNKGAEKKSEKSVRFGDVPLERSTKTSHHPILKKQTPIQPLKVNFNTENTGGKKTSLKIKSEQYQKLVTRLCKTESVIQSLKLSLCSMQTTHETADREKNIVIEKLKEEISHQENKIKKQEEEINMERRSREDVDQRWKEAEMEVKQLLEKLDQATNRNTASSSEDVIARDKLFRKIEELKKETSREQEMRETIENSHLSLLSRVQDIEDELQRERAQADEIKKENINLKSSSEAHNEQTKQWNVKAREMEQTLAMFKEELDAKEEAIRRLINEQQTHSVENATIASQQNSLQKEIKECNIVLEAQKSAFTQLQTENRGLQDALEEERAKVEDLEEDLKKKQEENMERGTVEEKQRKEQEKKLKSEMRQVLKKEKQKMASLEAKNKTLESCLKKQEIALKEKEEDLEKKEQEWERMINEEKQNTALAMKDRGELVKTRENLMKELNKAASDVTREKGFLQQQLEEIKLEQDILKREKNQLEEENVRLMDRVASVEQQEAIYKRAQDLAAASNLAKGQLSYDNGKLKTRVEQLEEELRNIASVQSQVVQLRATNRALEQKYSQVATEVANSRVESNRTQSHVKQLQHGMERKEADFNLAITARDEAVRDKEAAVAQIEVTKDQEKSRVSQMKRELSDCRSDNARLSSTIDDITTRQSQLQEMLDQVQTKLGRKDGQLSALTEEKSQLEHQVHILNTEIAKLESTSHNRDAVEQSRIAPALEALERARHDNVRLAASLDDVLRTNAQLKDDLDKCKTDLEIQRERNETILRQQKSSEEEALLTSRSNNDRLQQMKEQFNRERSAIKRQLTTQVNELKKTAESAQSRNTQLTRGNSELRSKLADREQTLAKQKEKMKQQKISLDRMQAERKSKIFNNQRIKEIDSELGELEKTKQSYIEKHKEQASIIATFNTEVSSLQEDIAALSHAQKLSRETSSKLESELGKEKAEKEVLINKIQSLDGALKRAINEKQTVEEKLRKVQVESIQVQHNLQEAQSWFKNKFQVLENELPTKHMSAGDMRH
ncbi:myoplasmin-C1 [Ciona intestinalis]